MRYLKLDEYYSTDFKWNGTCNACIYCGKERELKLIATGHDHTDYSYSICNCEGAKKHGKPYKELK